MSLRRQWRRQTHKETWRAQCRQFKEMRNKECMSVLMSKTLYVYRNNHDKINLDTQGDDYEPGNK
jgi:hypothetical protein